MLTAKEANDIACKVLNDTLSKEKEYLDEKIRAAAAGGAFCMAIEPPDFLVESALVADLREAGYSVEFSDDGHNERLMTIGWE